MKTLTYYTVFVFMLLSVYSNAQHCPQNLESKSFSRQINKDYGEDIISFTACRQMKDSKIIQKIFFNLKNNQKEPLNVWFRVILDLKDGSQEIIGKDSMLKTLQPGEEISGWGDNADADFFIEIKNNVSAEDDKVDDINLEIFSVYKVSNGQMIFIPSEDQKIALQKKNSQNVSSPPQAQPGQDDSTAVKKNIAGTDSATALNETPKNDNIVKTEPVKSKKELRREAKERKKREKEEKTKLEEEKKLAPKSNEENKTAAQQISADTALSTPATDSTVAVSITPVDSVPDKAEIIVDSLAPTPEDIDWAKIQVLEKIKQLEKNFNILSNKKTALNLLRATLDNTVSFFIDEDQWVEVSSLYKNNLTRYKIRSYCTRLSEMPYDSAQIQNVDVYFVTGFKKNENNQYEAVAAYVQRFTGFIENKPVYSDITEKKIKVILSYKPKMEYGETTRNWELLLGDIRVLSTRAYDAVK